MSGATGLDYQAVEFVARVKGIEVDEDVLTYIQVLESDQLQAWADERKRKEAAQQRQHPEPKGKVRRGD